MPRFYFDIVDGGSYRDDTGVECLSLEEVRISAMGALPDIAKEKIRSQGDRSFYTVVVRDEGGRAIYTATLGIAGLWLNDRPDKAV